MTTTQEWNNQVVITLGNAKDAIKLMRDILEKQTEAIHRLTERIEILEEKGKRQ